MRAHSWCRCGWMRAMATKMGSTILIFRGAIWRFSGLPSIPMPEDSETFLDMTVDGWKTLARRTVTAGRFGLWDQYSAIRKMLACAVQQGDSSKQQFPLPLPSAA